VSSPAPRVAGLLLTGGTSRRLGRVLLWSSIGYGFAVALLILVLLIGRGGADNDYGAKRWIYLGVFDLQASEVAKLAAGLAARTHLRIRTERSLFTGTLNGDEGSLQQDCGWASPAGVPTKKNRYINGMNAIERIMACCCGSSVGIVVMRWLTNDVMVMMISSSPGMGNVKPGIGMCTVSGWPRLGSHRN